MCPTGIDISDDSQIRCTGCAACMDWSDQCWDLTRLASQIGAGF
ncbi:hypothetical protein [Marinobacter nauticus]